MCALLSLPAVAVFTIVYSARRLPRSRWAFALSLWALCAVVSTQARPHAPPPPASWASKNPYLWSVSDVGYFIDAVVLDGSCSFVPNDVPQKHALCAGHRLRTFLEERAVDGEKLMAVTEISDSLLRMASIPQRQQVIAELNKLRKRHRPVVAAWSAAVGMAVAVASLLYHVKLDQDHQATLVASEQWACSLFIAYVTVSVQQTMGPDNRVVVTMGALISCGLLFLVCIMRWLHPVLDGILARLVTFLVFVPLAMLTVSVQRSNRAKVRVRVVASAVALCFAFG